MRTLALAAALAATGAEAEELRFAIGWPPGTIAEEAVETYASAVEEASGGAITVEVFPLSLLNFAEASGGVRDGIADVTTILTPYFVAEFPSINRVTEMAGLADLAPGATDRAPMAFAGALAEYVMLECDACRGEALAQNQVFTSAAASPGYILQCVEPVRTADELEGLRIRTGGAFWSRWTEAMGAVPVSISINETFEGLNQGVIDCTAASASEMTNFGFIDVVSDLTTDVPGAAFASSVANVNADAWRGLDDAGREALLRGGAALAAHMTWNYWEEAGRNLDLSTERGIALHEAAEGLSEESRAFVEADVDTIVADHAERFGLADGEAAAARMRELVERWTPLVEEAADADALAEIYWREVMSKVDPATYGM